MQNYVFVLDTNKVPQAPIHAGAARLLLREGKAAVYRRLPFTLILKEAGTIPSRSGYVFGHGAVAKLPGEGPHLVGVYHPSQQNTQTGRLSPAMYARVWKQVRKFLES